MNIYVTHGRVDLQRNMNRKGDLMKRDNDMKNIHLSSFSVEHIYEFNEFLVE